MSIPGTKILLDFFYKVTSSRFVCYFFVEEISFELLPNNLLSTGHIETLYLVQIIFLKCSSWFSSASGKTSKIRWRVPVDR